MNRYVWDWNERKIHNRYSTLIRQHSCHSPHNSHTITHLWGQDRVCLFQVPKSNQRSTFCSAVCVMLWRVMSRVYNLMSNEVHRAPFYMDQFVMQFFSTSNTNPAGVFSHHFVSVNMNPSLTQISTIIIPWYPLFSDLGPILLRYISFNPSVDKKAHAKQSMKPNSLSVPKLQLLHHWSYSYQLPNVNDCTIEVWESISNFIPYFIMDVITYPCRDYIKSILVKRPRGHFYWHGLSQIRSWKDFM